MSKTESVTVSNAAEGELVLRLGASSSNSASPQNSQEATQDEQAQALTGTVPPAPPALREFLHNSFASFDSAWSSFDNYLSHARDMLEFGHARSTFREHLQGTFGLLSVWGLPQVARRAGLFHTGYSGDLFYFCLFRSEVTEDRAKLRELLGEEAEELVYKFGSINRATIINHVLQTGELPVDSQVRFNRQADADLAGSPTCLVSTSDAAMLMFVTVADYLDQLTGCNAWKDIYQVDRPPALWPGSGKPGIALHWLSKLCRASRNHLPPNPDGSPAAVPALFDNCTATIEEEEEVKARDTYWAVVRAEDDEDWACPPGVTASKHEGSAGKMSDDERIALLTEAIRLNRFVAEPHVLLAQVYFRRAQWGLAALHCTRALKKFYALGTSWDKRHAVNEWVYFTRITLMRARRLAAAGATTPDWKASFPRLQNGLARITDIVDEIEAFEA